MPFDITLPSCVNFEIDDFNKTFIFKNTAFSGILTGHVIDNYSP